MRYVRAIDPAGHVIPLVVSTNRIGNDNEFAMAFAKFKQSRGWLLIDDAPYGMSLDEWREKCLEEHHSRTKAYNAKKRPEVKTMVERMVTETAKGVAEHSAEAIVQAFKEMRAEEQPRRGR
jgi:hypothetical protein